MFFGITTSLNTPFLIMDLNLHPIFGKNSFEVLGVKVKLLSFSTPKQMGKHNESTKSWNDICTKCNQLSSR